MITSTDDIILPDELRRALDHAAELVAKYTESKAPQLVDSLIGAARERFEEAVVPALRARNAGAICFPLPNELWVKVWSMLDTRDRLNVSHVSHGWRLLAVSTPSLWASISLACRIGAAPHTFFCSTCVDSDGIEMYRTNIGFYGHVLPRSEGASLSVRVSADAVSYYSKYPQDISNLLRAHRHRIVRLEVRCPIVAFFNELADLLLPLPALRTLIVDNAGYLLSHAEPVFQEMLKLPALQTLEISFGFRWDPDAAQLHLPSVKRLTLSVSDPDELRAALRACTALQHLWLHRQFGQTPRRWDARLVPYLRRVSSVVIECVDVAEEAGLAEIFEQTPSTSVSLLYLRHAPTATAFSILRSLRGPVRLSCGSAVDQQKEMTVSDASRTVHFTWPDDPPSHLHWSFIARGASLPRYETDTRAWPGVLWVLPCAESVDELTLRLNSAEEFNRVVQYRGPDESAAAFPGLSVLRLHGDGERIALDTRCVVDLVNMFCATRRLRSLWTTRVNVSGGPQAMVAFTDELRVR